jgi:hypothetical protein
MKLKVMLGFLGICLLLSFGGGAWADEANDPYPIMRPDIETRLRWIHEYETAPRAYIDASRDFRKEPRGSLSLLSHLEYTPSQRNQGSCGNCWAWAGTGVVEIALDVQEGIYDRLSIQYLNSCFGTGTNYACCGGSLTKLGDFYTARGQAIPWFNTNASFQDGSRTCSQGSSAVSCGSIVTSPGYGINSIVPMTIPTHELGQATAIANIKNVLNQQKAVYFSFCMGTQADWNSFFSFWNTQSESVVWDFDPTCDHPWTADAGCHGVLCVGYNDDNPSNAYWIMVNSWGTEAGRPNGLFRVAMDMNYDCLDSTYDEPNLNWQTLDVSFGAGGQTVYVDRAGTCNGFTPCSSTIQGGIGLAATGATIKIAGGTYPEDVNLNVDKNLSFKGGYNSTYSTQTMETVCRKFTIGKGTAVMDKVTVADTPAPPPPADVASVVFFNNLVCGGKDFTATFTIGGETLTSISGEYSNCEEVNCGKSLSWSLYASSACGTISGSGTKTLTCNCLYEFVLGLSGGNPALFTYSDCPGDCSDVSSPQREERQLLDCEGISKDAGLQGLESLMAPFISK